MNRSIVDFQVFTLKQIDISLYMNDVCVLYYKYIIPVMPDDDLRE